MTKPTPTTSTTPAPTATTTRAPKVNKDAEELKALREANEALEAKLAKKELEELAQAEAKEEADELTKSMREFRSTTPNSRYITKSNQEVTFRSAARKVGINEDGTTAEVVYGRFITNVPGLIAELNALAKTNPQITAI